MVSESMLWATEELVRQALRQKQPVTAYVQRVQKEALRLAIEKVAAGLLKNGGFSARPLLMANGTARCSACNGTVDDSFKHGHAPACAWVLSNRLVGV